MEFLGVWFRIGLTSFGGPGAQIAMMQEQLVDQRRWISPHRFAHALSYCMILPGPEAQQMATYMGWLLYGRWGGLVAGGLFILPGLLVMLALSAAYLRFGNLPEVQSLLYGLRPAVLALVVVAVLRLREATLNSGRWWAIALIALAMVLGGAPVWLVIAVSLLLGYTITLFSPDVGHGHHRPKADAAGLPESAYHLHRGTPPPVGRPSIFPVLAVGLLLWLGTMAALRIWTPSILADLGLFFTKAALITFGGAYAVLPYVNEVAVERNGWLAASQMMDALALGETTPGPLVLINSFVGALAAAGHESLAPYNPQSAALWGGLVAAFFTFLPSFVLIFLGAPWVEKGRGLDFLSDALKAVRAAVVALIFHLALVLAVQLFWPLGFSGDGAAWKGIDLIALLLSGIAILLMRGFRLGMLSTLGVTIGLGWVAVATGLVVLR